MTKIKTGLPENSPEFPTHERESGRIEAEDLLFANLKQATLLLAEGGPKTREGILSSLDAVIQFLIRRGLAGQLIWPLGLLRKELEFISDGNRSQVFQPVDAEADPIEGRRFIGPGKKQIQIFAAARAESIYKLGQSSEIEFNKLNRKEADKLVADNIRNWPAYDRGKITGRTIKGWRDRITASPERRSIDFLVLQFTRDETGRKDLSKVLKYGPPLMGGYRGR